MIHFILCFLVLEVIASTLKLVEEVLGLESGFSTASDTVLAKGVFVHVIVVVACARLHPCSTYRYAMSIALHFKQIIRISSKKSRIFYPSKYSPLSGSFPLTKDSFVGLFLVIKLKMRNETFGHSFYGEEEKTTPTDFIYDEVYKSASSKNKYSQNPKYMYYNALLTMKQKLSQEQSPVFESLFNPPPRKVASSSPVPSDHSLQHKKTLLPIYHVEKINKMKFKIYKQNGAQFIDKLPVTDLSFQIKIKGEEEAAFSSKPRLQEILNQYRKMNINSKQSKSRSIDNRQGGTHGSDLNMKTMRKTFYRFGRSENPRK